MVQVDSVLDLVAVVLYQTLYWPGCSVAQGADSVAFDLFGQLPEHVDLGVIGLTNFKSAHSVSNPTSAFSAWGALTTTFMLVKFAQPKDGLDDIG